MMLFKPEDNLKERSNAYWQEIKENSYFFDRKFLLNQELAGIKLEDVIGAFNKIFIISPKKLSIQVRNSLK
jgi:secreted Zn-dependent insulinase-like peptidase